MNNSQKVKINENLNIRQDSDVLYASEIGVGANDQELRLIIVNQKLVNNDNGNLEFINESKLQIAMKPEAAINLNKFLTKYIEQYGFNKP
ncbi:hypothetical protein LJC03_02350 [Methanobrevibacter sp. OttesenSCG-928-I08]|nr:hypothetical protein [Methanobrevibacter sp. OttesenSCG-928-I08]